MNNKKNNRKGFTIVELVIVIAVIAILATVLVPTFGNIIEKANKTAAMQEARNELTQRFVENEEELGELDAIYKVDDYYFVVKDGNYVTDGDNLKVYTDVSAAQSEFSSVTWATISDGFNVPTTVDAGTPTD